MALMRQLIASGRLDFQSGFERAGRTRKLLPTRQHDCLQGRGGATEQKQGLEGERACSHKSLMQEKEKI